MTALEIRVRPVSIYPLSGEVEFCLSWNGGSAKVTCKGRTKEEAWDRLKADLLSVARQLEAIEPDWTAQTIETYSC